MSENTTRYFNLLTAAREHLAPHETAFMTVDIQHEFFDPHRSPHAGDHTEKASAKAGAFLPVLRAAGVSVYNVYLSPDGYNPRHAYFYNMAPARTDHLVLKTKSSAFEDGVVYTDHLYVGELENTLKDRGIKNIIIAGGFINDCVARTTRDALQAGFKVYLVDNMICNGKDHDPLFDDIDRVKLISSGAVVATARAVYDSLGLKRSKTGTQPKSP